MPPGPEGPASQRLKEARREGQVVGWGGDLDRTPSNAGDHDLSEVQVLSLQVSI